MNCKQGQLVRYVGTNRFLRPNIYGWIGKTVSLVNYDLGELCWVVDPPLPGGKLTLPNGHWSSGEWVADHVLRPILDDPGTDETLTWTPVPSKLKEKA